MIPNPFYMLSGVMGSMVAVTAVCDVIDGSYSKALIVGIVGGVFTGEVSKIIKKWKWDDPVDAMAVHFGGGVAEK